LSSDEKPFLTPAVSSAPESTGAPGAATGLVAPLPHTIALVVVLLVMSAGGAESQQEFFNDNGRLKLYLLTLGWEWALTLYVMWGLRLRRVKLSQLIAGRWNTAEDALRDAGIGVGFWISATAVLAGIGYLLGMMSAAQIEAAKKLGMMLPRSGAEIAVWLGLSATAGFCEEVIFRGYLQRQFATLGGRVWVGVAAQAAIFGGAHAYEGWRRMILIAIYGVMFGVLAQWRKSLRPGMLGHALQDSVNALASGVLK